MIVVYVVVVVVGEEVEEDVVTGSSRPNCAPMQTYDTHILYYYYLLEEDYVYVTGSRNILL